MTRDYYPPVPIRHETAAVLLRELEREIATTRYQYMAHLRTPLYDRERAMMVRKLRLLRSLYQEIYVAVQDVEFEVDNANRP